MGDSLASGRGLDLLGDCSGTASSTSGCCVSATGPGTTPSSS